MQNIRIDRLGAHGDGISGEGVVAPFALPGETVLGEVVEGVMAAPEIVEPSPDRVAPPCPHFGACGGCALQHGSDAFLAAWKSETIARALSETRRHDKARNFTQTRRP